MESVSPIFIFDACSIINLHYIDYEDDYLKKKLLKLSFTLSEEVFNEITSNIYKQQLSNHEKKEIDIFLGTLRNKIFRNSELIGDLGKDSVNVYAAFNEYHKRNGEFYSTLLSLLKSRCDESFVYFVTDDYPAHKDFISFFEYHQIGSIINSCDFISYLYWSNSDFSEMQLKKYLTNLRSEYRTDISTVLKIVREFKQNTYSIITHKNTRILLENLERDISINNLSNFNSYYEQLKLNAKTKDLAKKLEPFTYLYQLNNTEKNTLYKTDEKLSKLSQYEIFKLC